MSKLMTIGCCAVAATALQASAGIHDFPSNDSTVVGSVGFIDDDEVGYFWSVNSGHSVSESFADALPSVGQAIFDLSVVTNVLSQVAVNWDVVINGVTVGNFDVPVGFTGDLHLDYSFASIPANAGMYDVSLQVTNEVPGGAGSHTFAYAGNWMNSVELVPAPGSAALLALAGLGVVRRRR